MNKQYILAYGDIATGLTFLGIFLYSEDATRYAERYLKNEQWTLLDLFSPTEENERSKKVRVVMPKSGGMPFLQFWHADEEDGEPNLRSDYRVITDWAPVN